MALSDKTKITSLYKERLGVGNTRTNREFFEEALKSSFSVHPEQIWSYSDFIPGEGSSTDEIDAIRNLTEDDNIYVYNKDESTTIGLVKYYKEIELQKIDDGTDNAFKLCDDKGDIIRDVIPFNFYKDVYNYTLKDSQGFTIPFGVGDWVFDTHSGILTFNGDLPDTIDHNHPPLFTFYRYIGGHGFRTDMKGFEAALIPIQSFEIPENTFAFTASPEITLQQAIIDQADKVESNFVQKYGFDGADNNEGVATGYEYVVPLLYSKTKDKVKGYDDSNDSSVLVLLTKNKVTSASDDAFMPEIKFVSNKVTAGEHFITVNPLENYALISFDNGPEVEFVPESIIKLDSDNGFIVVETSIGYIGTEDHKNKKYNFTVEFDLDRTSAGTTTAGLFYWSIKEGNFIPFFTKEKNVYDFSFPIVMQNGKIPPSVKLNAESLQYFEDSITPDYYGPRLHSIVVALEGTDAVKSADYVVKNSVGFYVKDIFAKIKEDHPNFKGVIYFRSGTYQISNPVTTNTSITDEDLNFNTNLIIQGEDKQLVKFTNEVSVHIDLSSKYFICFKDLTFDDKISLNANMLNSITFNNVNAYSLVIEKNNDYLLSISNSSIKNCIIVGQNEAEYYIDNSSFDNLSIKCSGARLTNNTIQSLTIEKYANILSNTIGIGYFNTACDVTGNTISLLNEKVEYAIFRGNYVSDYSQSIADINGVAKQNTFPIYNNEKFLKYTVFENPIEYNSDTNKFIVKYDNITIQLNKDGKLHVVIDATQISVYGAINYPRDPSFIKEMKDMSKSERKKRLSLLGYVDNDNDGNPDTNEDLESSEGGKYEVAPATLEDILKYIFRYKADLINGKVPLQQIPDSIAGGGLHYCSNWSIEENGRFPQFNDIINDALKANYDTEVEELQPGWFVVVDSSRIEEKNPTKEQFLQPITQKSDGTYTEGLSKKYPDFDAAIKVPYTAGDWIIFSHYLTDKDGKRVLDENGNLIPIWDKVDRSYNDPIYTRLPSTDFYGKNWKWNDENNSNPGDGTLDFTDNTLYEAVSKTNEELNKLKVKQPPLLSKFVFEPIKDYDKISCKELTLDDSGNRGYLNTAKQIERFDATNLDKFEVISSKEDNWNSYIYFGDKAFFKGFILHNDSTNEFPENEALEYIGKEIIQQNMCLMEAVDPFKNEFVGHNYWKGTKITFSIDNPDNGVYKIYATENNITPLLQAESQSTSPSSFEFLKNYSIKATANEAIKHINFNDLNDNYVKWNCGRPYLSISDKTLNYKVSFTISKAFCQQVYDKVLEFQSSSDDENVWHSFDELSNLCTYEILRNKDEQDYFDLVINELKVNVTNYESLFWLKVKVFDLYGNEKILDVYNRNDFYGSFDVQEIVSQRVFSGILSNETDTINNPTFSNTSTTAHFAGNPFNHKESLEYNIELMASEEDGIVKYSWPKGTYYTIENKIAAEYESISGQKILTESLNGKFRFATFNLGEIKDSNGFLLSFDSENIDFNNLTCVNENMSIQVLIDEDKVWYNANKPMAYLFEPKSFDDACMYAGSSSMNRKRISFGQRLLTGKVYVRIGIEKNSNISISNIKITNIV